MTRGGLVDNTNKCIAIIDAASGLNTNYMTGANGPITFAPDNFCNVGDSWNGSAFVYGAAVPPAVTINQATTALTLSGLGSQLATAIAGATTAEQNLWSPGKVTSGDAVIQAVMTAAGLNLAQINDILRYANTLPP